MLSYRTCLVAILLCHTALAYAGDMYKWVDDKGAVHYSSSPPPVAPAAGVSKLKPDGQIIQRAESQADKAAKAAAAARKNEEQTQKREQQRLDQALLERFDSEAAIVADRDRQLAAINKGLKILTDRDARLSGQIRSLHTQVRSIRGQSTQVPAVLIDNIDQLQRQLELNQIQVGARQKELAAVRDKAEQNIQRHRLLTGTASKTP